VTREIFDTSIAERWPIGFAEFYRSEFLYFADEESSCLIDMWPESLLEDDFEASWIFRCDCLDDSFVLESIHRTSGVEHLTSDLEGSEPTFEELCLDFGDIFYIF
jgi:hypothetical protein